MKNKKLNLIFESQEHEDFFNECIKKHDETEKGFNNDFWPFFYTIGIDKSCRANFPAIFRWQGSPTEASGARWECFNMGFQTSGSMVCCRLAFNLMTWDVTPLDNIDFNGMDEEEKLVRIRKEAIKFSPIDIFFSGSYFPYLMQALTMKYELSN